MLTALPLRGARGSWGQRMALASTRRAKRSAPRMRSLDCGHSRMKFGARTAATEWKSLVAMRRQNSRVTSAVLGLGMVRGATVLGRSLAEGVMVRPFRAHEKGRAIRRRHLTKRHKTRAAITSDCALIFG